jgi:hypothetical protein
MLLPKEVLSEVFLKLSAREQETYDAWSKSKLTGFHGPADMLPFFSGFDDEFELEDCTYEELEGTMVAMNSSDARPAVATRNAMSKAEANPIQEPWHGCEQRAEKPDARVLEAH